AGGLVGLHPGAEHGLGVLADLFVGLGQLDAAGLAAATGVDLRLDHPEVARDGLGGLHRFLGGARDAPGGYGDAVVGKQLLCLVFVEIHVESMREGGRNAPRRSARTRGAAPRMRRAAGPLFSPMRRVRAKNGPFRREPWSAPPGLYSAATSGRPYRLRSIFAQPTYT